MMMPDRETVIEALEVTRQLLGYGMPRTAEIFAVYSGAISDAIALLKEQEQIVRCSDCKHGEPCNEDIYCEKDIGTIETSMHKPDWFCADGQRMDDDVRPGEGYPSNGMVPRKCL